MTDASRHGRRAAGGRRAPGLGRWIRATGYHEQVAGDLDRDGLDRMVGDRPTRVQHRTGAMWVLNSAAVSAAGLDGADEAGIERDGTGRPTGRVFGADAWLRSRVGPTEGVDLAAIGAELAGYGVTGVTDATPTESVDDLRWLASAVERGELPQLVVVTGGARAGRDGATRSAGPRARQAGGRRPRAAVGRRPEPRHRPGARGRPPWSPSTA